MNGNNNEALAIRERGKDNSQDKARTTIGIRLATKDRLDDNRAPGQCYDGFIWQMVDLWERSNGNGKCK